MSEAYELNQKRKNTILGGMHWIKMQKKQIKNAIDLSALNLDRIEEKEDCFEIGAMCSLRDIEKQEELCKRYGGILRESVKHIVGTQFRNTATIGGSIFGRFGFSDILTALLALDTYVELYKKGKVSLAEFVDMKPDNDILVRIIIMKDQRKSVYQSFRQTETDFPILTSAVSMTQDKVWVVIGARPAKATLISMERNKEYTIEEFAEEIANQFSYGSNMRGSAQYRKQLAKVSVCRALETMEEVMI